MKTSTFGAWACSKPNDDDGFVFKMKGNLDPTQLPQIKKLIIHWDSKKKYILGFDVEYSNGFSHQVLSVPDHLKQRIQSKTIEIADGDYMNDLFGYFGGIIDKIEVKTKNNAGGSAGVETK